MNLLINRFGNKVLHVQAVLE